MRVRIYLHITFMNYNSLFLQVRKDVRDFLNSQVEFFSDERNLQLRLSNWLENNGNYDSVKVEYYVPYKFLAKRDPSLSAFNFPWNSDLYIDIVVEKAGEFVPIELKYPTADIAGSFKRFGELINDGSLILNGSGAHNDTCYKYWRDVRRLEALRASFCRTIVGGLAIMVTNDLSYQAAPKSQGAKYAKFAANDGRQIRKSEDKNMSWQNEANMKDNGHPDFLIDGTYSLKWEEMKDLPGFYFLILDV